MKNDAKFDTTIPSLMQQAGVAPAELCRKLNIARSVLDRLKKNEVDPRLSTLLLFTDFFNVSLDELVGQDKTNLSVSSWEILDKKNLIFEVEQAKVIKIKKEMNEQNTLVFRVASSAMAPKFEEGIYIYVDRLKKPKNNDLVVALVNQTNTAIFRKLNIEGDQRILVSTSVAFEPIKMENADQIVGVVVDYYGEL